MFRFLKEDFATLCVLFVLFLFCIGSAHCYSEYVDCISYFDDDRGFANLFSTYQPGVPDGNNLSQLFFFFAFFNVFVPFCFLCVPFKRKQPFDHNRKHTNDTKHKKGEAFPYGEGSFMWIFDNEYNRNTGLQIFFVFFLKCQ